ncbi:MAG: helix-turn-helix transcriptional regulator [Bacteroidetes bacterium]|nr:helix-turn-helix transcriptional regulator [Bacteroidota bacterium]
MQTQSISLKVEEAGYLCLNENVLLFVCEGEYVFYYGEDVFKVRRKQVVFLRKHTLVRYQAIALHKEPVWLLFVLSRAAVLEFAKSSHLQAINTRAPEMVLVHQPGARLLTCMTSVEAYLRHGASLPECLEKIKLLELLFCLPGSQQDQVILEQLLDLRESPRGDITNIIEDNITNAVSLRQLARLSGRSLSSFRRDFRNIYNMPPSRWIRLKRLEKARELLDSTTMTVTNICYTLGFENIAHFSRLFKEHFGLPPSAIRLTKDYSNVVSRCPAASSSTQE